jgi:hypothetical protein
MENLTNLLSVYWMTAFFLVVVVIASVSHLLENRKIFSAEYALVMWIFTPLTILSLFYVLYAHYSEKNIALSICLFFPLAYVSSFVKSCFRRTVNWGDEKNVKEVFHKLTPSYPGDSTNPMMVKCWHMSIDILAFVGLWFSILIESKALPWLVSIIHRMY